MLMDHLSTFRRNSEPPKVPYLGTEPYDSKGFSDYPHRKQFDKEMMFKWGDFGLRPKEEVEGFFQNWLFFGLVCDVLRIALGHEIDINAFVRTDSNERRYVTTETLPQLLQRWESVEQQRVEPATSREHRWSSINSMLDETRRWINRFGDTNMREQNGFELEFWPMSPVSSLSILSLCATLHNAAFTAFNRPLKEFQFLAQHSRMLTEQMLEAAWCKSDVAMLLRKTDILGQYYFSTYTPSHRIGQAGHSECLETECLWDNVDGATYRPAHVSDECRCPNAGPSSQQLTSILSEAAVPIIKAGFHSDTNKFVLAVSPANDNMRYVAISHVCESWVRESWFELPSSMSNLADPVGGKVYVLISESRFHGVCCFLDRHAVPSSVSLTFKKRGHFPNERSI